MFYCWNYEDNPEGGQYPYTRKDEMPWCSKQCVWCKVTEEDRKAKSNVKNTD